MPNEYKDKTRLHGDTAEHATEHAGTAEMALNRAAFGIPGPAMIKGMRAEASSRGSAVFPN